MKEYRVNLESYNGPLDLLLYLIRREEVDIYDIPISRITQQYIQYVEMIHELDPNLAGEFLVLAASLMEIKSRLLLPTPPPEENPEQGLGVDPRTELVRQLLEYKAFKDAAGDLSDAAALRAQKFPRKPYITGNEPGELDMEDVQLWDLMDAFGRIMASIGKKPGAHEVIYDDTPLELHASDILDRLQREGPLTFSRVFEGRKSRGEMVGLFIALLELVRQKKIFAAQDESFADIRIELNPNPPTSDAESDPSDIITGDQTRVEQMGQYESHQPQQQAAAPDDEQSQEYEADDGELAVDDDGDSDSEQPADDLQSNLSDSDDAWADQEQIKDDEHDSGTEAAGTAG